VLLTTILTSLTDGGTAGLLWGFIVVVAGFYFVYLSIAEVRGYYASYLLRLTSWNLDGIYGAYIRRP
jgi:amino acid permease